MGPRFHIWLVWQRLRPGTWLQALRSFHRALAFPKQSLVSVHLLRNMLRQKFTGCSSGPQWSHTDR